LGTITHDTMQRDLLNQATQERFLLLSCEQVLIPNLGQLLLDPHLMATLTAIEQPV
jgi:hypothetical protein